MFGIFIFFVFANKALGTFFAFWTPCVQPSDPDLGEFCHGIGCGKSNWTGCMPDNSKYHPVASTWVLDGLEANVY